MNDLRGENFLLFRQIFDQIKFDTKEENYQTMKSKSLNQPVSTKTSISGGGCKIESFFFLVESD